MAAKFAAGRAAVLDLLLHGSCGMQCGTALRLKGQTEFPPIALVAIEGGYGRAELNPQSDVDFMFLA